jgi:hypothetical protein
MTALRGAIGQVQDLAGAHSSRARRKSGFSKLYARKEGQFHVGGTAGFGRVSNLFAERVTVDVMMLSFSNEYR